MSFFPVNPNKLVVWGKSIMSSSQIRNDDITKFSKKNFDKLLEGRNDDKIPKSIPKVYLTNMT